MQKNLPSDRSIRLAEIIAALSLATDLGMGQPLEYALHVCILSVRLADALGFIEDEAREVYYLALLRHIGCNAETYTMAALFGDELAVRSDIATVDSASNQQALRVIIRAIRKSQHGSSQVHIARLLARAVINSPRVMRDEFNGFCEVAERLAERLGFGENIIRALGQVFQRWDGRGLAGEIKGEQIVPSMRVVGLTQDAVTFHRLGGTEAAVAMVKERRGTAYDPAIVDCFCRHASQLTAGFDQEPSWEEVLALEPGAHPCLSDSQYDQACQAMAYFSDIKSPFTLTHSSGVAELAAGAARHCGFPEGDSVTIGRAALLHDIGRSGISAGIWGKPGPLTEREWERVRMHPYYTERILARPAALAQLGTLASLHHERLDGSGYHRGLPAAMLTPLARILSAADVYHAMTEPRPHRPAHAPERAAEELRREVRAGRLDREAVEGVLAAAGHRVRPGRREYVAGLSEREIEVLRLLARGHTIKQIADSLVLSDKTVDNHIQHIYNKTGVSTRAGATLFAMEQSLLTGRE